MSGQSGIVIRFRHLPVRDMKGHNASGAIFNAYCVCPMGRWLKSVHSYELRRCFADLAAYPQLQLAEVPWSPEPDNQYRHHPRNWDDMRGVPSSRNRYTPQTRPFSAPEDGFHV